MHAVNNLSPWELQIQGVLWKAAGLKLAWERRVLISKRAEISTLREELEGSDFLPHPELEHLL